jgi:hypothetical protein
VNFRIPRSRVKNGDSSITGVLFTSASHMGGARMGFAIWIWILAAPAVAFVVMSRVIK